MQRHREVASAPKRSTHESVATISALVRDSLARSESIDLAEVDAALAAARPALLALVAGGHLEQDPVVLAAGVLHLSITTVSGDQALTVDENLSAVPGAARAETWTLYLPNPEPLAALVEKCARAHRRLVVGEAASDQEESKAKGPPVATLDIEALLNRKYS